MKPRLGIFLTFTFLVGLASTARAMEEEGSALLLSSFWNTEGRFEIGPEAPVLVKAINYLMGPYELEILLEPYKKNGISSEHLNKICRKIIKSNFDSILYKWIPFLGLNLLYGYGVEQLHDYPQGHRLITPLKDLQWQIDMLIFIYHFGYHYSYKYININQ